MTSFDKQYLKLCKEILKHGKETENRTGVNTIKIPSYNFSFDLEKEFPILQSKKVFVRSAITEMLWIWQMQSNDVRELQKRNVPIWNEWMVDEDGIYRIYDNNESIYQPSKEVIVMDPLSVDITESLTGKLKPKLDDNGKIMTARSKIPGKNIVAAKYYGKEYANTIGTAYGWIVDRYKFTQNLIETLKNNPQDRRMVYSLWQNEFLRTAVLPSCVWSTEWDVTDGKLNLSVHQRSCDVPLGLPFNITQYATLLCMIAQVTGLKPGKINYSIKDAHIYTNQIEGIKEQLKRQQQFDELVLKDKRELLQRQKYLKDSLIYLDVNSTKREQYENELLMIDMILNPSKPELWLNPEIKDFFEFDNSKELKDSKIKNYKSLKKIKFKISQ